MMTTRTMTDAKSDGPLVQLSLKHVCFDIKLFNCVGAYIEQTEPSFFFIAM